MAFKSTLVAAVLAASSLSFSGAANAAPVGPKTVNVEHSQLEQVHYRGYRHCHGPRWNRHCHGGRAYRSYGYGSPGVSIYIGKRGYGHRHRDHRDHRDHRR